MLNICHVSPFKNLGGMQQLIVDLLKCNEYKNRQIRHVLLSTESSPQIAESIQNLDITSFHPERKVHYDPQLILKMASWLKNNHIHIVHSYGAIANTWANLAAILARTPKLVCGEHGSAWWITPPTLWFDKWAYRRANCIVANSKASATMLNIRYRTPRQKVRVVHNGVPPLPPANIQKLRAEFELGTHLVIGSIGRLDTPKNYSVFINVASDVLSTHPNVRFVLIGGGPLEQKLRTQVTKLGIDKQFIFTGWRTDARELVQILDIFVSTSIRESFGNTLVEAALAAKPVIAPKVDGIPEVVIDQQTGLLLNPIQGEVYVEPLPSYATPLSKRVIINGQLHSPSPLNTNELADAIRLLINRPDLRQKYGLAGQKRAEQLFSIGRYKQSLESIYMELAQSL